MVFFTCDSCNESLKKKDVDRHCSKCRSCESVTCIDCGVTFYGDDYRMHTTCITEAQKYEKSLFKPTAKASPQDIWMSTVQSSIQAKSKAPEKIREFIQRLSNFDNIPRNKSKFCNFCKNSLNIKSPGVEEDIWSWIVSFQSGEKGPIVEHPKTNCKVSSDNNEALESSFENDLRENKKRSIESTTVEMEKSEKKKIKKEKKDKVTSKDD